MNMKDTIYVVSGFMRTGTSMMMRCLQAGGLDAVYQEGRDKMNDKFGDDDYQPNKDGFYEMFRVDYQQPHFPRMYAGRLIKCLFSGLPTMVVHDYKVVFMLREHEEIRQSYEAFFHQELGMKKNTYTEAMQESIDLLHNRKDTHATVLQYRDVVKNPQENFEVLRNNGWPINVSKAVSVVNQDLCRFRLEKLTVGI